MVPRPCTEQQLCGVDLKLLVVTPSVTAKDEELRFRCPVNGCHYLGATITRPSDCLKHLLGPKIGDETAHRQLLAESVVSFRNAEGRPQLNSKPNVPSAILYSGGVDGKNQYAYMKVTASWWHDHACDNCS